MIRYTTVASIRAACDAQRAAGRTVGFVPTMGALHQGHLQLVRAAKEQSDFVVVSIFVNPTQFGPNEDFGRYPRDLDRDCAALESLGVDAVFAPPVDVMYPPGACTWVRVDGLTEGLCGAHRPGHFQGVATVVSQLFHIVGPCVAVFGRKDYQQLQVVRRLVHDLHFPVTVVGIPTVRERDGLAMSSRNTYLSPEQRRAAGAVPQALTEAHRLFAQGARVEAIAAAVRGRIAAVTDRIDYVTCAHPDTLEPVEEGAPPERLLVAVACHIGTTRLIDNTVLGEDAAPLPL